MYYKTVRIFLVSISTLNICAQQPLKLPFSLPYNTVVPHKANAESKKAIPQKSPVNKATLKKNRRLTLAVRSLLKYAFESVKTVGLQPLWKSMLSKRMATKKYIGAVTALDLLSCVTVPIVIIAVYNTGIKSIECLIKVREFFAQENKVQTEVPISKTSPQKEQEKSNDALTSCKSDWEE